MGKRQVEGIGGDAVQSKKAKKTKIKKDTQENGSANKVEDRKSEKQKSGKNKSGKKQASVVKQNTVSVQEMLTDKLKSVQNKRNSAKIPSGDSEKPKIGNEEDVVIKEKRNRSKDWKKKRGEKQTVENESNASERIEKKGKVTKAQNIQQKKAVKNVTIDENDSSDDDANDDAEVKEMTDLEKAEMQKKKREKRKQKKLEKEKRKQEQSDKAGTAKSAAVQYLEDWKTNRTEWKFLKVRQCWLLNHMYDQSMVSLVLYMYHSQ